MGSDKIKKIENETFNSFENNLNPIIIGGDLQYKIKTEISNDNFSEFTKFETQSYEMEIFGSIYRLKQIRQRYYYLLKLCVMQAKQRLLYSIQIQIN